MTRKDDLGRRPDHWIILDRSWAQRLGVRRTAGMYRIRSRDLARRLSRETLWMDASGRIHASGWQPAAASADRVQRLERGDPREGQVVSASDCRPPAR
jgi:hypothetical protein